MKINNQYKNGIIQLSFLIIVGLVLIYLSKALPLSNSLLILDKEIQAELEKQKIDFSNANQRKINKYYVNKINDYKGYQLGLSVSQIDSLLNYLNSGKLIFTKEQFKEITQLTTHQFRDLENKLVFPQKKRAKTKFKKNKANVQILKKFDLNTITAQQLKDELNLPQFIALRIIKFRKLLKGYKDIDQIEKVYSILPYQIKRIKKYCYIK